MRTLLIAAIGFGLLIQLLYLSLAGLSSTLAKYDYCYDVVMAAKYAKYAEYALPKPDFAEYGLKSEPECKQQTHDYEVKKNGSARGQRNGNAETLRAYVLFMPLLRVLVSAFFFNGVHQQFYY